MIDDPNKRQTVATLPGFAADSSAEEIAAGERIAADNRSALERDRAAERERIKKIHSGAVYARPGDGFAHRPTCTVEGLRGEYRGASTWSPVGRFEDAHEVLLAYPDGVRKWHAGPASRAPRDHRAVLIGLERDEFLQVISMSAHGAMTFVGREDEPVDLGPPTYPDRYAPGARVWGFPAVQCAVVISNADVSPRRRLVDVDYRATNDAHAPTTEVDGRVFQWDGWHIMQRWQSMVRDFVAAIPDGVELSDVPFVCGGGTLDLEIAKRIVNDRRKAKDGGS
jgi:hypothetical protein